MNKSLFFTAVFSTAVIFTSSALAQETTSSSVGLTNYLDRTSYELRQLRGQIDAVVQETPLAGQSQLAPYVNALSLAEQALADFKTAPIIERDHRQVELETAKQKAIHLWSDYRPSHQTSVPGIDGLETVAHRAAQ